MSIKSETVGDGGQYARDGSAAFERPHVLVVDDDRRLRSLLHDFLSENGFMVATADDAADAREKLNYLDFDALVLDVMMPGENGIQFMQEFRNTSSVPILLLTAMDEVKDRIAGFEGGADDYLAKPFEPRELVLRLNAILRRAQARSAPERSVVRFGGFVFDPVRGQLDRGHETIRLTTSDSELLRAFSQRPNSAVAREFLADHMGVSPRTVDVQIARLRRKIEPDLRYPRYLLTVRGEGYVLRVN